MGAGELNARLQTERLRSGRGLDRADDPRTRGRRRTPICPEGTVVALDGTAHLLAGGVARPFSFTGWGAARAVPGGELTVLTPPTSVLALAHGFAPVLHPSTTDR